MRTLILLPPSEGKTPGGTGRPYLEARVRGERFPELAEARAEVMQALRAVSDGDEALEDLFEVKGKALQHAVQVNRSLLVSPTLPAIERYAGVLYEHLAYETLPAGARKRFDESAAILSGLMGLVAPRDPVPDYKLKMDASLPGVGSLQAFWRERLTPVLDAYAEGKVVWNLLPNAHAAAWANKAETKGELTACFVEVQGGRERTVSHWNKALKGALVRHLLLKRGEPLSARAAMDFEHEGYRYDAARSSVHGARGTLVFSKET